VRFLECAVKIEDVSTLGGSGVPKLKARSARVIREVTIDGVPL
jgi:hypothetical protein